MRQVDFFALPRAVQERFLASTGDTAPPHPLAFRSAGTRLPIPWILSGLLALVALIAVIALGFGDATSPFAIGPGYMLVVYGVAIWWLSLSVLEAIGAVQQAAMVPFRRGLYLFPGGVIDARAGRIAVSPLSELVRAELTAGGAAVRLAFRGGASWDFPLPERGQGPALVTSLETYQQRLQTALAENNTHDVALLDPLIDTGIHSPLMPTERLPRRVAPLVRHAIWLSLLPALGLAWPLWNARNAASETHLFVTAQETNSPEGYLAYLAAGGTRPEVRDLLLPRAELEVARRTGSTEAVAKVVEVHASTPVRGELEFALREMLLAEIETARKAGTATAIRELGQRLVRRDLVEAELAAALHGVYVAALERFKQAAAPGNAEIVPFVRRLLAHTEQHGPRVEVRFRRALRSTVATTDEAVKKNPYYPGPAFQPSQYFSPERAAARESIAFDRLRGRFAQLFPVDIVELVEGPILDDPAATYPVVTTPTLFFSHETLMGGVFAVRNPTGVFAGVGVVFELSFRLPNRPNTLEYQLSVWQTPELARIRDERLKPEEVYETMASNAFERFLGKLMDRWFVKA